MSIRCQETGFSRAAGVVAAVALWAAAAGVPPADAQSPPGTPASVTATRGNGTLEVSWSAVAGATGYNVNTTADHKQSWQRAASVTGGSTTSANLGGIDNEKSYYVAVQAVNGDGVGGWRDSTLIEPLQTATAPASVTLTRAAGYVDVSWTAPLSDGGSQISGYDIVLSDDGRISWWRAATGVLPTPANGTYKETVTDGISNTTAYDAAVRAVSAAGPGPWKNAGPIAGMQGLPAAPASVTVYRGSNFLDVEWPAVTGATSYNVVYSPASWRQWTRSATAITTRTHRIPNVPNNASYIVAVQAVNAIGAGHWLNSEPNDPALDPSPAQSVQMTTASDQLRVSWTQCDVSLRWCNGGSPVTGYFVNVSNDGGASWTRASTLETYVSGSAVNVTSGIEADTAYVVSVGIENRVGTNWTNVSVRTPAHTPKEHAPAKDFGGFTARPGDIWSDGKTMYVTWWIWSIFSGGIRAYDLATGTRDESEDLTLHADNNAPFGVWANLSTIYTADSQDGKIYAYNRSDMARDTSKEFDLHADNANPYGIWSDGLTLWVTDSIDGKAYAYKLADGTRDASKDISDTENGQPEGLWSDGTTIWMSDFPDGKLYAYKASDRSRDSSKDFELAEEHASPSGIWSNGTTMYVTAFYAKKVYAYNAYPTDRDGQKDFGGFTSRPGDIWSDGTTMYVTWWIWSIYSGGVRAYDLATGTRDTSKDLTLHANNTAPFGVWANLSTIYTADSQDGKIYAYNRSDMARDTSKEFDLHADNANPYGIWSDGLTLWVTDSIDGKAYAYNLADGTRDSSKDISDSENSQPEGLWSDGTTFWLSDFIDGKLYAYKVSDRSRDSSKDYELAAEHAQPGGVWSNGTTLYVTDYYDSKVYAYRLKK